MGLDARDLVLNKPASPSFSSEQSPSDLAAAPSFAVGGPSAAPASAPAQPPEVKIYPDFWEDWFG